jgi:eukaryotic-like serine/threonine-protein kinase
MNLDPGHIVDNKYRIVRLLGAGGMGAVYEGENLRIRRRVAIKLLHASVSSAQDVVTRFEREAQAAGTIGSEHICEVLDLGVLQDGTKYMVMEYLDGETLSSRVKRLGRMIPTQSIPIMLQVLEGLGAAHTAGIVHRDLKPDNIFLLRSRAGVTDFVKIIDFGVSKFTQMGGEEMNVTRADAVIGTPYYMSPEQARGGAVDARSDIYALGVLLYQASTGQVPFQAATFNELLFKIALETPPPPQHYVPDLDAEFAAIISRAMARDPAHRFQSCFEFRDVLLAWQVNHTSAGGAHGTPMGAAPGFGRVQTAPPGYLTAPPAQAAPENPQATANAWGQASSTTGIVVPAKSNALTIALSVLAAVVLSGGALLAYLFIGNPPVPDTKGSTAAAEQASPPPPASAAAPAPPPPASPEPPASAAPPAEDLQFETNPPAAAPAPAAPGPVAKPPAPPPPTTVKPSTAPTVKPPTTKKPPGGFDPGY